MEPVRPEWITVVVAGGALGAVIVAGSVVNAGNDRAREVAAVSGAAEAWIRGDHGQTPKPPPSPEPHYAGPDCTLGYDPCLPDYGADYDCAGGPGDGPHYSGKVNVQRGMDIYDLDRDETGLGCESASFWGPAPAPSTP